ncbi:MAG: leucine-rich repeat protein [Bacilli bacterium]|nr:leucine-rich repeat protein [Bacilli bacterium]
MKKSLSFVSLIMLIMVFLSSCVFVKQEYEKPASINQDVTISLICDDHVSSDSEQLQNVKKGETASFHLLFDKDYIFKSASIGDYDEEKQILTIDSINGNATAYIKSEPIGVYKLVVNNDINNGEISIEPKKEFYHYDEKVILKVTPTNKDFLCYTFDAPYRNGVKQISGVPISYDQTYELTMHKDMEIYVNYFQDDSKKVTYDLNEGKTVRGNSLIETDYKPYYAHDDYLTMNTINLSNYAFKDGHVLESLNTNKDGSGLRIGVGSRINNDLFNNNSLTLYAQWKKYSDNKYFVFEDVDEQEVAIKSATINEEEIVIPAYNNNKKVTVIKSGAFNNLANVKKIIIPDTIKEIEDGAFVKMNNVTSLTFYSSIEKVSKESFDMANLKTLFLNKNTLANEWNYEEDNLARYRDAIMNLDKSKDNVLFIGHSTIRVNHDLSPSDDKWGDKYNFFIYGATAGIHGYLLMMSIADIIGVNDYVVVPIWPILNYSTARNVSFLQYNFDVLQNADYQIIKDFFWKSFTDYRLTCTDKIGVTALLPEAVNYSRWDKYGMNLEDIPSDDINNKSPYDYTHYLDDYNGDDFAFIDDFANATSLQKDHVLLTWNTYNQNNIDDTSYYVSFEERIRNRFNEYTFFDTQLENIYPGNYFNKDDFMHLSCSGATHRVNRWLNQLPLG